MAKLRLNGHHVRRENETLRGVTIFAPAEIRRASGSYSVVQVGISREGRVDWIGSWDQRERALPKSVPVSLIDSGEIGRRLRLDDVLVIEVAQIGSPTTLLGSTVEMVIGRTGGRQGPTRALVSPNHAGAESAALSLVEQINRHGLGEVTVQVPLRDAETSPGSVRTIVASDSFNTTTDKDITSSETSWTELHTSDASLSFASIVAAYPNQVVLATATACYEATGSAGVFDFAITYGSTPSTIGALESIDSNTTRRTVTTSGLVTLMADQTDFNVSAKYISGGTT